MIKRTAAVLAVVLALCAAHATAEEAYYDVSLTDLRLTEGQLPADLDVWRMRLPERRPYAVLDGEGEAYIGLPAEGGWEAWYGWESVRTSASLAIAAPAGQDVTGHLYLPRTDAEGMERLSFAVAASQSTPQAKGMFLWAKQRHYEHLLARRIPGAAWFRHQVQETQKERTAMPGAAAERRPEEFLPRRTPESDIEETYAVLTGGRAISENLQLDRALLPSGAGEGTVDVATLPGITVQEMDWAPLLKDVSVEKDPLAALIPADQHALLFPSFNAFMALLDEAREQGTPVLRLLEARSEDSRVQERYERQLCLSASLLSRLLGPQLINAVAMTGTDPFMPAGTDVALVYEAKDLRALRELIDGRVTMGAQAVPGAKRVRGTVGSVLYTGMRSEDRAVCSYVATVGSAVVVTNSLAQLERIANASEGKAPSLASLPEYAFFRSRYPRGDEAETALLIVPDGAIRRWCGAQWRIADSRRTRAAALMAELQAEHADDLVKGTVKAGPIEAQNAQGLGQVSLTPDGVSSSIYGDLEFMTPIAELAPAKVTEMEAAVYRRWRDSYQGNWRQYFDPIAVRFSVGPDRLTADLTVMPLIETSDYRDVIALTRGASISGTAGDPHQGALLHAVWALSRDSEPVREVSRFATSWGANLGLEPLAWVGQSVAVYADDSPFWQELADAKVRDDFMEHNWYRTPVALVVEVAEPMKLAIFLASLRAFIESSGPGLTVWENPTYGEQPYVKVHASAQAIAVSPDAEKTAVYYAALPDALIVTLSEDVLKAALDRRKAKAAGQPVPGADRPWLGSSMCARIDQKALTFLRRLGDSGFRSTMRQRAWDNIPILNEWKRRYPDRDPVEVHQKLWKTRLVCPGGGTYVWNEEHRTMMSTVYGHPAEPKEGPGWPQAVLRLLSGDFGVTFEHLGLRARAVLERTAPTP
jgi:hypothetical protein